MASLRLALLAIAVVFTVTAPIHAEEVPRSSSELEAALFFPASEVEWASGPCSVTEYCALGGSVSCNGGSTCSAGDDKVTCDGTTYYCACEASLTCPDGTPISCQTQNGSRFNICEVGPHYVNCDEHLTYCPVACTASTECSGGFSISCNGYQPNSCFEKTGFYIECDGVRRSCDDLLD